MRPTTEDTPPSASRRALRIGAWAAVVIVVAAVLAVLVDSFAASRAEHRLAVALQASPGVEFEPAVTMGGLGFLLRSDSGEFESITISAPGVPVRGCHGSHPCRTTLDSRLTDVRIGDTGQIGPETVMDAAALTVETRIDSPTLGRLMNIVDLYINTPAPEDRPGGGGPGDGLLERTAGIMLSGTVPLPGSPATQDGYPPSAAEYSAPKVKVSVSARVFVVDGLVHIEATDFYDGPEEHYSAEVPAEFRSAVLKAFSAVLPPLPTAWGHPLKHALSRGSDLIAVGEAGPVQVRPIDYAKPL